MSTNRYQPDQGFFIYQTWLDGGVIFDRRSGYTHLLDSKTMSVFLAYITLLQDCINTTRSELTAMLVRKMPDLTEYDIEQGIDQLSKLSIISN